MVDPNVRKELLQRLGISKQALSVRAKSIKNKYGPMNTDEAVYVIAHLEGIDLSKYLTLAFQDRIRALIPRQLTTTHVQDRKVKRAKPKSEKQVAAYPLVSADLVKLGIEQGKEMYPQVFVLENSIRKFILKRLTATGEDWWENLVPGGVKRNVNGLIDRESKYRFREPRGNEKLQYCSFSDLARIILEENNRKYFEDVIIKFDWFAGKMDEVAMARNNLAHSLPLSTEDQTCIRLFYSQWARLLETSAEK